MEFTRTELYTLLNLHPSDRPLWLIEADLSGVNLTGANLIGAKLSMSDLTGTKLSRADLSKADLDAARLGRANLVEARLRAVPLLLELGLSLHIDLWSASEQPLLHTPGLFVQPGFEVLFQLIEVLLPRLLVIVEELLQPGHNSIECLLVFLEDLQPRVNAEIEEAVPRLDHHLDHRPASRPFP